MVYSAGAADSWYAGLRERLDISLLAVSKILQGSLDSEVQNSTLIFRRKVLTSYCMKVKMSTKAT